MLGKNPARDFNYLFEPVEGAETDESADVRRAVPKHGAHRRRPAGPNYGFLALVAVAIAVLTAAMVVLLLRPDPAGRDDAPVDVIPPPMPTSASPIATTQPVPPPPPAVTSAVVPPTVQRSTAITTAAPVPTPSAEPPTAVPAPEVPAMQMPATRAPISVQPEPRVPFPNQAPDYGSEERGGLLGGGGLL